MLRTTSGCMSLLMFLSCSKVFFSFLKGKEVFYGQKAKKQVVMNHMGNEFYFEGHQSKQAPWRIHEENGLREYQLHFRKEQKFNSKMSKSFSWLKHCFGLGFKKSGLITSLLRVFVGYVIIFF